MGNLFLVQALAELAYSIAMLDGKLEKEERRTFYELVDKELQENAWMAKNRFFFLEKQSETDVEKSFNLASSIVKRNRSHYSNELKGKFQKILLGIAGDRFKEREIVQKFNSVLAA